MVLSIKADVNNLHRFTKGKNFLTTTNTNSKLLTTSICTTLISIVTITKHIYHTNIHRGRIAFIFHKDLQGKSLCLHLLSIIKSPTNCRLLNNLGKVTYHKNTRNLIILPLKSIITIISIGWLGRQQDPPVQPPDLKI